MRLFIFMSQLCFTYRKEMACFIGLLEGTVHVTHNPGLGSQVVEMATWYLYCNVHAFNF